MIIVTISRLLGSQGEQIGARVAEELGIPLVDREIIHELALRSGVSEEVLEATDERRPSLLARLSSVILGQPLDEEMGFPINPVPAATVLTPETLRALIEDVILAIADRGSAVIIGRGAHLILKGRPNVLRVQTYAPLRVRVGRIVAAHGLETKAAEKLIHDSDRDRGGYMRTYFGVDWREPLQYDLMINTGKITEELAVNMIVSAAEMVAATT